MANIRVRIKNVRDLEAMLPKLKRSLTAQYNVELEEEGQGKGVFALVVKDVLQLKQFALIKKLLDSYGFEFYLRTVDEYGNDFNENELPPPEAGFQPPFQPEDGCNCESCREFREKQAILEGIGFEVGFENIHIIPVPKAIPKKARKVNTRKAEQDRIAKELIAAVAKMKIDLAKRI